MTDAPAGHRVLIDTNVVIDLLRGHSSAVDAIDDRLTAGQVLCISTVTNFEVLAGARAAELDTIHEHLSIYVPVVVDESVANAAGELARRYRRSHAAIDAIDYLIAASAQLHADELLTLNVKHFPMFMNLRPPYRAAT